MSRASYLTAIFIILTGSLGASARTMTLISQDKPAPVIVVGAKAAASEKHAAEELATFLEKITGKKISIVDDGIMPEGKIIAVGKSKLTESIDISGLDCEQFITDVQSNMVIIIGGRREAKPGQSPRDPGTLYGVYEFLDNLGVRWYRPEPWGEHVPKMAKIKLKTGRNVSPKPSYTLRCTGAAPYYRLSTADYGPKEVIDYVLPPPPVEELEMAMIWTVRNRTNTISRTGDVHKDAMWVAKLGGGEQYDYSHIYEFIIPVKKYFETHPEYFAMVDGKRAVLGRPGQHDLCLGNPELQRVFAENVAARAKANPNWDSYSVEPSDGMGSQCQCELCKAMDEPKNPRSDAQGSNRVCAFNNMIAERVAKEAPWAKVQWLGYATHTAAPTNLKQLQPNTIIMLAPINEWSDWTRKLMDSSSPANSLFVQTAKNWTALKPYCLMTYDYFEGYGWPGPLPVTRTVADRMREYRKLGIKGLYHESVTSWGPQGLDKYMTLRLTWNPDMDVDKELNLYYKNYYGPAEKPMKAYHARLMRALEEHKFAVQSGGRGMHLVFTPPLVKELGVYMDEAQALVKGQPLYERRLKGVWAGYEFSRRISDIIVLKKKTGVITDTPGWNGQGSYYKCAEAEEAYRDLIKWMRSVNNEDSIFDLAFRLRPSDNPRKIFIDDPGTSKDMEELLCYLGHDVLKNNLTPNKREEVLLKDF